MFLSQFDSKMLDEQWSSSDFLCLNEEATCISGKSSFNESCSDNDDVQSERVYSERIRRCVDNRATLCYSHANLKLDHAIAKRRAGLMRLRRLKEVITLSAHNKTPFDDSRGGVVTRDAVWNRPK